MMPRCPRCFAPMLQRLNQRTGLPFWGCPNYPRCRGTRSGALAPDPPDSPTTFAELRARLQEVTRERDTLRVGYEHLLGEVQQLRAPRLRSVTVAHMVQELTRLLSVVHPDKWGGESAVATALTQEVLALRERLQEGRL